MSAVVLSSRLKDREVEVEALRERLLKFETKLERVQQESKLELQECIRGYQLKLDEVRTNFETMLKIEVGTMLTSSSTAMNEMIASSSTAVNEMIALSKLVGKDVSQIWRHIKNKTLDWRHLEKMQQFLGVAKGGKTTKSKRGRGELKWSESEEADSWKKKRRKSAEVGIRRRRDRVAASSGNGKEGRN